MAGLRGTTTDCELLPRRRKIARSYAVSDGDIAALRVEPSRDLKRESALAVEPHRANCLGGRLLRLALK
jgi:hypothetical protein